MVAGKAQLKDVTGQGRLLQCQPSCALRAGVASRGRHLGGSAKLGFVVFEVRVKHIHVNGKAAVPSHRSSPTTGELEIQYPP